MPDHTTADRSGAPPAGAGGSRQNGDTRRSREPHFSPDRSRGLPAEAGQTGPQSFAQPENLPDRRGFLRAAGGIALGGLGALCVPGCGSESGWKVAVPDLGAEVEIRYEGAVIKNSVGAVLLFSRTGQYTVQVFKGVHEDQVGEAMSPASFRVTAPAQRHTIEWPGVLDQRAMISIVFVPEDGSPVTWTQKI